MAPSTGVLFDVDGTLLDTNYLHVLAWWRALRDSGIATTMAHLHSLVGKGSDKVIAEFAGGPDEALNRAHSKHYASFRSEVVAFPGAAELLRVVAAGGAQVWLATSAKAADVDAIRKAVDADGAITGIVTSADVEASKPDPDIFEVALRKAQLAPDRALAVGDSVWDIQAAAACGLGCVAVESGGIARAVLEQAGATAVYSGVDEIRRTLSQTPLASLLGPPGRQPGSA